MEEQVGIAWHKLINQLTARNHPEAVVQLSSVTRDVALLFRALGGPAGHTVQAGEATRHGARRSLLERLAGRANKVDLAWVDNEALRLPAFIDAYPSTTLNRDLYFWLAALCAVDPKADESWFIKNQAAVVAIKDSYAGLAASYHRLVEAETARRPDIKRLPADEAEQEQAIRAALLQPGSVISLPSAGYPPHPVLLWLRPDHAVAGAKRSQPLPEQSSQAGSTLQSDQKRRVAEHEALPARQGGLLLFRPESIFSWTEYAKVSHETQDNEDQDLARAADDLDVISITRDNKNIAKKLRMSLDLSSTEHDTNPLNGHTMQPEWDYRTHSLKANQCRINHIPMTDALPCALPEYLKRDNQRMKRQFSALQPVRQRFKNQAEGNDIDIDPYIRHIAHHSSTESRFYIDQRKRERDLSCLLLADLSLSTEAWVGEGKCIIDVIRDSLFLFSEALSISRDRFALYGFNSKQRTDIRFQTLKSFDESYNDVVRGRILQIKPAYYTRMGAAIRHSTDILVQQKSRERLLLLLTDGKPNDADHYEGRYGIEDTRKALIEARQKGLRPFCVTVDQNAGEYLPHIFGKDNFIIIRKPSELPTRLPLLYAQLTR